MNKFIEILLVIFLVLILTAPIILIYIFVFITTKGSPIFWSDRIGMNNKIFKMPKFRALAKDTPLLATHLINEKNLKFSPCGSFLRRYSLDELPQLISIIKGDLALVGPRPALFNQNDLIILRTKFNVHKIKPGITGWAQVNGRDSLNIKEKVELDIEYIKRRSIKFDIYILFLTFFKIIKNSDIKH